MVGSKHTTFALALDVDGVLHRGTDLIADAPKVLATLKKRKIPFLLLTNGGGQTEEARAQKFTKKFGVEITPEQVQLSHTPMKEIAPEFAGRAILAVGKADKVEVLKGYGFDKVVTVEQYHAMHPALFPDIEPELDGDAVREELGDELATAPIEGVFCIMDPLLWSRELQIVCDVLRSDGRVGKLSKDGSQVVPIYTSCPDFEYVTEFPIPRFGSGTFGMCVDFLYTELTGRLLEMTTYGKPNKNTYEYAERALEAQVRSSSSLPSLSPRLRFPSSLLAHRPLCSLSHPCMAPGQGDGTQRRPSHLCGRRQPTFGYRRGQRRGRQVAQHNDMHWHVPGRHG